MDRPSTLAEISIGSEVAVMPAGARTPTDVLAICKVELVTSAVIRLSNGTVYDAAYGDGLLTTNYIMIATDEHREVLKSKSQSAG